MTKTREEIEIIRANCQLVSLTLAEIAKEIKPGITTLKLDQIAEQFIRDHGAEPGFKGYHEYPNTLCTSVNEQVVHGIPSNYVLKEGDILSVDVGTKMNGFYGDSAYTFTIGEVSNEVKKLLKVTKESLLLGIRHARAGQRVGEIGYHVQNYCESHGYSVVRELVGHGMGRNLHEKPEVPNYGLRGRGMKLMQNMVICIEPMINLGKKDIQQEKDGWTVRTLDRKPSAHFELAVAINGDTPDILSTFEFIEKVLENKN